MTVGGARYCGRSSDSTTARHVFDNERLTECGCQVRRKSTRQWIGTGARGLTEQDPHGLRWPRWSARRRWSGARALRKATPGPAAAILPYTLKNMAFRQESRSDACYDLD